MVKTAQKLDGLKLKFISPTIGRNLELFLVSEDQLHQLFIVDLRALEMPMPFEDQTLQHPNGPNPCLVHHS